LHFIGHQMKKTTSDLELSQLKFTQQK